MRLFLILVLIVLLIVNVNAVPFFVSISTNDEDNVYGVNDNRLNMSVRMNSNRYVIYADFATIETGSNGTQRVVNNGDGSYTINYTILSAASTNSVNLTVIAFDNLDNTTLSNNSFNVKMDNINPVITNQAKYPFIAFNTDNLILNGTITDIFGLKQVLITGNWQGSLINYTAVTNTSNIFSHIVNSSLLENGEILIWKYIAADKANNVGEGNLIISRLNSRTNISFSPSVPNGLNGWYLNEPIITLLPDINQTTTFFRFNSFAFNTYTEPFNRSSSLGGVQDIFYFTNFTNIISPREEPLQEFTFKVDTKKPEIRNLVPANNSFTGTNTRIYALIDDVFVGTSGINLNTVKMFLDNDMVNANVNMAGTLSANASFNTASLLSGIHNVTVNAIDFAGNNASLTWFFNVDVSNISSINVLSPENKDYGNSRVPVTITLGEKANKLWIFDVFSNKTRLLCRECNLFNKTLSFKEGQHIIRFIASDNGSNNTSVNVNFLVDIAKPKIIKLNYKNKTITNSTFFNLKYSETLLDNIKFYYRENTSSIFIATALNNCNNRTNANCNLTINSAGLDGKTVVYYFNVTDKIRSVSSKKQEIYFDFSNPVLNVLDPDNINYNTSTIRFDIQSNEKLKSLTYTENGKTASLCSNCLTYNKTRNFGKGVHNLVIKSIDFAGNSKDSARTFTIV